MPDANDLPAELVRFLADAVDPAEFRHADHVRIGFEMLSRHPFSFVVRRYAEGLQALATRAGRPAAYHETITIAFLSLIAERMAARRYSDFAEFAGANPDLFDKSVLTKWYAPERLQSEIARRTFVLPQPQA